MPEGKCFSINLEDCNVQDNDCAKEPKWGFQITGGADFGMPITIFQVTEGGQASQVGLKLGDTITKINNVDTSEMTLAEAHAKIEGAEQGVKLSVVSFEDDEEKVAEERQVVLKAKKEAEGPRKLSVVDLEKPKEKTWIPQPERKVWHPIVWQQPPPPVAQENYGPVIDKLTTTVFNLFCVPPCIPNRSFSVFFFRSLLGIFLSGCATQEDRPQHPASAQRNRRSARGTLETY
ncbi:PDZ and LIM domain protein 5 isoform X1 [Lutzomyia longipalpis]|uniref:PDZ and LIM domain protein 5 isoform X1 n=1 Tax=Lutzomyia longipalpis TaxID=7200 RepID=UPI0024845AB6|nr:PDZ and LIM domain protein 5 isoform X1 [Lutzomyia longipalpis]